MASDSNRHGFCDKCGQTTVGPTFGETTCASCLIAEGMSKRAGTNSNRRFLTGSLSRAVLQWTAVCLEVPGHPTPEEASALAQQVQEKFTFEWMGEGTVRGPSELLSAANGEPDFCLTDDGVWVDLRGEAPAPERSLLNEMIEEGLKILFSPDPGGLTFRVSSFGMHRYDLPNFELLGVPPLFLGKAASFLDWLCEYSRSHKVSAGETLHTGSPAGALIFEATPKPGHDNLLTLIPRPFAGACVACAADLAAKQPNPS